VDGQLVVVIDTVMSICVSNVVGHGAEDHPQAYPKAMAHPDPEPVDHARPEVMTRISE